MCLVYRLLYRLLLRLLLLQVQTVRDDGQPGVPAAEPTLWYAASG